MRGAMYRWPRLIAVASLVPIAAALLTSLLAFGALALLDSYYSARQIAGGTLICWAVWQARYLAWLWRIRRLTGR